MKSRRTTKTIAAPFDDARTVDAATTIVLLGVLSGIFYSFPAWLNLNREYPLLPLFDWWPCAPKPYDLLLIGLLVISALTRIFLNKAKWISWIVLGLGLFIALADQTRWQPWFYQYMVMLGLLAAAGINRSRESLDACCIVMSFTYFWSGLQKLNTAFCVALVPWLFRVQPELGYVIGIPSALIETAFGVLLLIPKTRKLACAAVCIMHLTLLELLYSHSWNSAVWPWNILMCALAISLFWFNKDSSLKQILNPGKSAQKWVAIALFGVLPLFNFFGLWDAYLSLALYSGNTLRANLLVTREQYNRLGPAAKRSTTPSGEGYEIDIYDWCLAELNVASYPEARAYQKLARIMLNRLGGDTVNLVYIKLPRFFEPIEARKPQ